MLNLFLLAFIPAFLVLWLIVSIKSYDFGDMVYASAINRLEVEILKSNIVARQIAVSLVAVAHLIILLLAIFVNKSYPNYIFNPQSLPYSDHLLGMLVVTGFLTMFASQISQKALNQLLFQKENLSFSIVQRAKKFNRLFNFGVVLFSVCLVLQLAYKALNV